VKLSQGYGKAEHKFEEMDLFQTYGYLYCCHLSVNTLDYRISKSTLDADSTTGINPFPKPFVLDEIHQFRYRRYHVLSGEDVLQIGILCLKHMDDPHPPVIVWKKIQVLVKEKVGKVRARYQKKFILQGLIHYNADKSETYEHGL